MSLKKIGYLAEELKLLGLKGSTFRMIYEVVNKVRVKEIVNPADLSAEKKWTENLKDGLSPAFLTINQWLNNCPPFIINSATDYPKHLKNIKDLVPASIIDNAQSASIGTIRIFSKQKRDYGHPKRWNYNPMKDVEWPDTHYSRVLKHESSCGDIKLVWELNRFGHVFDYVRAYFLDGKSYWCQVFCEELRDWQEANVYRKGPNWNSGQELAIRVLAWLFALYAFCKDPSFQEADFQRIISLIYLHGEHLAGNIGYAKNAVHNNHLIGEALGLYVIGHYFPWFKESEKWKQTGRYLLENDCLKQFYDDGGYCQNSHNYHRLALHYYIWAIRIAELNHEPLADNVKKVLGKSFNLLLANMNGSNGMLPNYGSNDGALLNPWTCCDFTDYRPLLSSLNYLLNKTRIFGKGPWEEELLWFFGPEALNSRIEKPTIHSRTFPVAGLHVIRRSPDDFTVFRCGSVIDRFGQADQLHVDLWWKGLNIAQDPGSYLYNDELKFHHHFVGTSAHNTVSIDDENQMLLYRRFKFLYWTKAKLLSSSYVGQQKTTGEHYGYLRLDEPIIHRRKVLSVDIDTTIIIDSIFGLKKLQKNHKIYLHWLLAKFGLEPVEMGEWHGLKLVTPKGKFCVLSVALDGETNAIVQSDSNIVSGSTNEPAGWVSRYYSYKEEALSFSLTVNGKNTKFVTVFTPEEQLAEVKIVENVLEINGVKVNLEI